MLKIGKAAEPQKIVLAPADGDDPESFIILSPITPAMRRRAQRAARRVLGDVADFDDVDLDVMLDAGECAARELIRLGISEWGGFCDEADAERSELALTPDQATRFATANDAERPTGTIDDLLADEDIFALVEVLYVRPDSIRRAEKNGLSGSPNGTSAAATPGKDTAKCRAKRKRRGAAPSARTRSTRSKRTPAKASGTS